MQQLVTEEYFNYSRLTASSLLAHQLRGDGVVSSVPELRERTAAQLEEESEQYLPFLSLSQPGQSVAASHALLSANNYSYSRVHCLLLQDG